MGYKTYEERREYYIQHRAHMLEQQKQRRDALRAAGLCTQCGFRKKSGDAHVMCDFCRLRYTVNKDTRKTGIVGRHERVNT